MHLHPFPSTAAHIQAMRHSSRGPFLWAALLLLCLTPLIQPVQAAERQRVALVLGGGGARGLAHVGVLQALEEMRIPIACVAGTSMGALVAGTYASGMPIATLQKHLAAADWDDLFIDAPAFEEQSYRRRDLARSYLPSLELGYTDKGLQLPAGAVSGQKIKLFINQLAGANRGAVAIEKLRMPLAIVAADIGSGEKVVFREGDLPTAMRASMSIPGLLTPMVANGKKLVDGGLVDNVPIAEARALCQADVVIAINVGSPLLKADEVNSLLSVTAQMVNILTEQNVSQSLATLRPGDVYIKPDLGDITASDFKRYPESLRIGYQATRALADRLQALAVPEAAYRQWRMAWTDEPQTPPVIDDVQVADMKRLDAQAVLRHVQVQKGQVLDEQQLGRSLGRMYGDGYFDAVDYSLLREEGRTVLRVQPTEREVGPDYLRMGINLYADSSARSTVSLRGALNKTLLNARGGELLLAGEIGTRQGLAAQWIQPLDAAQRSFVDAVIATEHTNVQAYLNDTAQAEYKVKTTLGEMAAGLNLGRVGRVRVGWRTLDRSAALQVGNALPPAGFQVQGALLSFEVDQQDLLYIPTRGVTGALHYFDAGPGNYSRLETELRVAHPVGEWVIAGRLHGERSVKGQLPFLDAASLGGFLNMTAFAQGQLRGDQVEYGHARLERSLGPAPMGLRGSLRWGVALEAGRVGTPFMDTTHTGWQHSAAAYLVGDTVVGPLSVGIAHSPQLSAPTIFFYLGR